MLVARFVCGAFVVDALATRIVRWRITQTRRTDLVFDALAQASYDPPLELDASVGARQRPQDAAPLDSLH